MTLTLRAVSLNDQPLTQPITAQFDLHGGTIGRADHNTLALPDPERHISREQAEITSAGTDFFIRNVGSSNPIMVRNQALARGESAPLAHNDQVRIGRYLLEVVEEAGVDVEATTRARGAGDSLPLGRGAESSGTSAGGTATRALGAGTAAPFVPPETPLSPNNPFADLLAPPTPSGQRPAASAAAEQGPASPWAARLPDDFDPFAPPAAPPARAPAAPAATGAFEDLVPSSASPSIDDMFGLRPTAGGDPLAAFLADVKPAPAREAATPSSTDPLVLFGAPARPAPPPEVAADRTPELHAAFMPPQPASAAPRPAPELPERVPLPDPAPALPATAARPGPARRAPATEPTAAPRSSDAAALWAAFCEGAGVKVEPPEGVDPELMRLAGTLLRASVDGTLQLMAVRSATRHELHAQVTVIQARNNNPLKFSPDGQAALEQLLQPPLRGFLPGPAALTEAMDDLVGHAIGTMAGTRSALEGVLARFAPKALQDKLVGKSVFDSLLPMAHKAKLWDLYLQHYETIREEAQEDFHALFGKAFVDAYEQQLERLRRERPRA
jgi:FHA domain-containing protein